MQSLNVIRFFTFKQVQINFVLIGINNYKKEI